MTTIKPKQLRRNITKKVKKKCNFQKKIYFSKENVKIKKNLESPPPPPSKFTQKIE